MPRPHAIHPQIFECAKFSLKNKKFPRLHVSVFNSNLSVLTDPDELAVHLANLESDLRLMTKFYLILSLA